MKSFYSSPDGQQVDPAEVPAYIVSTRFYTLANMPADAVNIVSMLEEELEADWPEWLKLTINEIIRLLEKLVHSCDAFGVWGPRTVGVLLFSSRNLDYNTDTGLNKYKLISMFHLTDSNGKPAVNGGMYSTLGFSVGLGALAGMSQAGMTVSEMNLDNSRVTFNGVPFPLRLRMVLENSTNLLTAESLWKATNNTNSFNFLIGSAEDAIVGRNGAVALETIRDYTGTFADNSSVEAKAVYYCAPGACSGWTTQTGLVHIGSPIPNAVWRSNHGFDPRVMATQEPLFNNTVIRYSLMHDLFEGLEIAGTLVDDNTAVAIVATIGTKGENYNTCEQTLNGDNVMSIAYAPGQRLQNADKGHFFIAWETGSGTSWRPAACSPYLRVDLFPLFY